MNPKLFLALVALLGIACGFISSHTSLGWLNLIIWIVLGIGILYVSATRHSAVYAGALFGFLTIAVWLATGFQGTPDKALGFTFFALALSVLGALCGAAGAAIFYWLFRRNR